MQSATIFYSDSDDNIFDSNSNSLSEFYSDLSVASFYLTLIKD